MSSHREVLLALEGLKGPERPSAAAARALSSVLGEEAAGSLLWGFCARQEGLREDAVSSLGTVEGPLGVDAQPRSIWKQHQRSREQGAGAGQTGRHAGPGKPRAGPGGEEADRGSQSHIKLDFKNKRAIICPLTKMVPLYLLHMWKVLWDFRKFKTKQPPLPLKTISTYFYNRDVSPSQSGERPAPCPHDSAGDAKAGAFLLVRPSEPGRGACRRP